MAKYVITHEALVPGVVKLPVLGAYVVWAATAREALTAFTAKYYLTTDTERLRVTKEAA